jgi:hypothetical protein
MQCILYKIYFWKVFHMYCKLICILYDSYVGKILFFCKKWVLHQMGCARKALACGGREAGGVGWAKGQVGQ